MLGNIIGTIFFMFYLICVMLCLVPEIIALFKGNKKCKNNRKNKNHNE